MHYSSPATDSKTKTNNLVYMSHSILHDGLVFSGENRLCVSKIFFYINLTTPSLVIESQREEPCAFKHHSFISTNKQGASVG